MRVFVVSDMEGVAGIVKWEQTRGGDPMYEEGRRLYTQEINAAVRGAKAAGATEIVVMDCHGAGAGWTFNSLVPEKLDSACEYVVQSHWTEYTEFLEAGARQALSNLGAVAPYEPGRPSEIVVDFNHTDGVEAYRHRLGVEIAGLRRIVSRADDWWSAWKQFFF